MQSKQYLTTHTIDDAHPTDIFALAPTQSALLTGSGASAIHVYNTSNKPNATQDSEPSQIIEGAHALGTHHLAAAKSGHTAVSVGFGGEVKVWQADPATGGWQGGGTIDDRLRTP